MTMRDPFRRCDGVQRRDILRLGSLTALGLTAGGWSRLRAEAGVATPVKARSCILIWLDGGPSHLDTFDPKPDAPNEVRSQFGSIGTSVDGLQICEHLPRLAKLADRYALVRSVSHNNHNHTPMIYYTLTGREVERPNESSGQVRGVLAVRH